jgi:Na+/H+-dicarboxylate symporter
MIAEVNVFGVLVSSVLLSALLAWVVLVPLRRVLAWCGFYRWTWHRHLVDAALFVLLWGSTTAFLPSLIRLL